MRRWLSILAPQMTRAVTQRSTAPVGSLLAPGLTWSFSGGS